ncbi:RND superfamily putative drug exporter [Actinoalloteichus hoggarensis]|uniref:MMPL family transporter n=1 Tax=Actinoalloteichus hoggarensis TaxID=1470176 RepID=UPI0018525C83|nr:MMPL family transporter [Actinoalloteichus hoggarensis]MBB5920764.1 RND superfamily putative drug exporter [Actinoalloteichus hoggarensis]
MTTRYPRWVLAAAGLLLVLFGVLAAGTMDSLALNRYEAMDSESVAAREVLGEQFGTGSPNVAILVSATQGTVDDAEVAEIGRGITESLAANPEVGDAWSYWSPNAPETLAAVDRGHALVLAWVPGDADHVRGTVLPDIDATVVEPIDSPAAEVVLGGGDEIFRVVAGQAREDFLRAELIILPLVALLLWAVYRRIAPALVTLGIGLFSVVGTLAILRIVTAFTEVSTFASNIALVLGIGLGVDYGLFVIYRFREELAAGRTVELAVRRTTAGAGRTVLFSGLTVAASLAVLFVFPFPFLSSFAYAGIAVVATAILGAVVVLPAALALLGRRVVRKGAPRGAGEEGFWHRTATRVMRRPVIAGGIGLVILLALGAPALGIQFGSPDDRIMSAEQPVRTMYDTIRADFATEDADAVQVVAGQADEAALPEYAAALSEIPGVLRVDSAAGSFAEGERVGEPGPDGAERFSDGTGTWLAVLPTGDRLADDPTGLVAEVRSVEAPFDVQVGGYPAELTDYRDGVVERLPLVLGLILVVTFVVLFLMTGSVIAPLKASVLNLLSLSVMFGVLVWGFQEGALSGVLGFTPTGSIEPSIVLLMFCIAYGLSMDYEVFLLARIKEDYDRTGDLDGSVPRGIARSAPLVTAAAALLAVSFAVYATSEITFLQQLGIGMALAVFVDATLIRGVLVPAFMRLAGGANWWAPGPLRRLHDRIGLREDIPDEPSDADGAAPEPRRPDAAPVG